MVDSDFESKNDEMERDNLQNAISAVERTLADSSSGKPMPLVNFVENAKGRIATLDKKIKDFQSERESWAREQAAIVYMAQKETALSVTERETFSGFLEKAFFTKNDFGGLETFYIHTWDRLSESGKDEMSHRIWEGVRKEEYTFGELPKTVREKETERAYKRLTGSSIELGSASRIPESDRSEFIQAYENGDREGAGRILERNGFKENMFRGHGSAARSHSAVDRGADAEKTGALARLEAAAQAAKPYKKPEATNGTDRDLSTLDLDGVKLVDAPFQGTSSDIPNGRTSAASQRGSTRGG